MSRPEKELKAQALLELLSRQQDCPIAHVKPHGGQAQFSASRKPVVIVLAGNRFGKTHALVMEAIAGALGYRPWQVPGLQLVKTENGWVFPDRADVPAEAWVLRLDGLPIRTPAKIVVVTGLSLSRGIGEIIQTKWNELWPASVPVKTYLGPLGTWLKVVIPNGSEVYFGSATQGALAFEGFSSDLVLADEPIPRHRFTALRRGLIDQNGQFRWTMTPLGDTNMAWVAADLLSEKNKEVEVIRGSSFDNPHIPREALERFFADPSMTEDERRARMTGEIAALGKRIVSTFTDASLLPPLSPSIEEPRILVVDPHHSRPPFLAWAVVRNDGEELVVFREEPADVEFEKLGPSNVTTDVLAARIKALEGREKVLWRICDPSFGRQKAKVLGQRFPCFTDQMAEYGLYFDARVDNDLDRGIAKLRDAFKVNATTGKSRLLICENCTNIIRALNFWSYKTQEGGQLEISEQYKDPVDVLRYLVSYPFPRHVGDSWSYIEED